MFAYHSCKLLLIFAALVVSSASCKKAGKAEPPDPNQGMLYPFRLASPIEVSSSVTPVSLFIDSGGSKWITYTSAQGKTGIIQFDGNTGDVYPNSQVQLPLHTNGSVTAHTEDAEGAIYFTSNAGDYSNIILLRYRDGLWAHWQIQGIPCREIYFNKADGRLYFVFLDQVHAIFPSGDFSNPSAYEKISIELNGLPTLIHSSFDGENIHLISNDRYFVMDTTGYVLFYTPRFNDIVFSYVYVSREANAVYTIGGLAHEQLFKMHEGRWARFEVNDAHLQSISVDHRENIYVTLTAPDFRVGRYEQGNIRYFTYSADYRPVVSRAPVAVDDRNVKWVAVPEGIVRLP